MSINGSSDPLGPAELFIDLTETGTGVRVIVTGEIDMSTADGLRDSLMDATRRAGVVEVDMSGVEFMDSRGTRALVEAWAAVRSTGSFSVVDASEKARQLLRTTGLDVTFNLPSHWG